MQCGEQRKHRHYSPCAILFLFWIALFAVYACMSCTSHEASKGIAIAATVTWGSHKWLAYTEWYLAVVMSSEKRQRTENFFLFSAFDTFAMRLLSISLLSYLPSLSFEKKVPVCDWMVISTHHFAVYIKCVFSPRYARVFPSMNGTVTCHSKPFSREISCNQTGSSFAVINEKDSF